MFRQTRKQSLLFCTLAMLCLLATACGGGLKSAIVGRWEQAHGAGEILEFFKDGTVTATGFGLTTTGDYRFIDDDTIRIDIIDLFGLAGSQVLDVSIADDTLTLSNASTSMESSA